MMRGWSLYREKMIAVAGIWGGAIDCTTVVWLGLSWDISLARKKGGGSLPCRVEPGGTMPPRWACDPPSIKPPVSCPPTYHSTHSCSLHPSTNTNTNTKTNMKTNTNTNTNTNTMWPPVHQTSCLLSADPPSNPLCYKYNPFRRPFVHAGCWYIFGRAW